MTPEDVPDVPRLRSVESASENGTQPSPKIRRTVSKHEIWRAWAATLPELQKVGQLFETVATENGLKAEMKLTTADNATAAGTVDAVSAEIDPRTWKAVEFEAGRTWDDEYFSIDFRRRPDRSCGWVVRLTVKSSDPGTAAGVVSRLREEIQLSVPRWAWVHGPAGIVVGWFTSSVANASAILIFDNVHQASPHWTVADTVFLACNLAMIVVILLITYPVLSRTLPPCEVRYANQPQSSGSKFLSGLLALWIIPIVISVAVAVLT